MHCSLAGEHRTWCFVWECFMKLRCTCTLHHVCRLFELALEKAGFLDRLSHDYATSFASCAPDNPAQRYMYMYSTRPDALRTRCTARLRRASMRLWCAMGTRWGVRLLQHRTMVTSMIMLRLQLRLRHLHPHLKIRHRHRRRLHVCPNAARDDVRPAGLRFKMPYILKQRTVSGL